MEIDETEIYNLLQRRKLITPSRQQLPEWMWRLWDPPYHFESRRGWSSALLPYILQLRGSWPNGHKPLRRIGLGAEHLVSILPFSKG